MIALKQLICYGQTHDSYQRLRRFAAAKTRFVITNVAVHLNRIAVGDCRDGILFYSYREVGSNLIISIPSDYDCNQDRMCCF